ncbi:MAG: hypothetical protein ACHQT8_08055 [Chlamydiales bacterium]
MTSISKIDQVSNLGLESTKVAHVPFVTEYVPSLERIIASYLGRQQVEEMDASKLFASSRVVVKMAQTFKNEDAECLRQGYDERMIAVFKSTDLSLWQLPEFNAAGKSIHIVPEELPVQEDGTRPGLMRFYTGLQHAGFIINVRKKAAAEGIHNPLMPDQTVYGLHAPYPRDGVKPAVWITDGTWANFMTFVYARQNAAANHNGSIRGCPGNECCMHFSSHLPEIQTRFLARLVQQEDPVFELAEKIHQIAKPVSELSVQQPLALQAPTEKPEDKAVSASGSSCIVS